MKTKFKETEIGMIPENWKTGIFKEILVYDIRHGVYKSKEFLGKGVKLLKMGIQYSNNKIGNQEMERADLTLDEINRFRLNEDDLVFSRTSMMTDGAGKCSIVIKLNEPIVFDGNLISATIDKKKALPNFYFYYFNSGFAKQKISEITTGTQSRNISASNLMKLPIIIPPLLEQENISKILSDLDSKIELNQQMNKTLEAIGKAIFKHWFLNFEFPNEQGKPYKSSGGEMVYNEELEKEIPKDWEVVEFNKIVQLTMGLSPKGESYNTIEEGIPLINGAADFSDNLIIPKKFTTQPTRVCEKGDLLFCIRGTIGNLTYADKSYCLGRGVASVTAFNNNFTEYVFFILNQRLKEMISKASGSVIIGLSKPDILNLKIILPKENVINDFHTQSELIFMRLESIKIENYILSKIRDFLLPKLMSGKIRVPVEAN